MARSAAGLLRRLRRRWLWLLSAWPVVLMFRLSGMLHGLLCCVELPPITPASLPAAACDLGQASGGPLGILLLFLWADKLKRKENWHNRLARRAVTSQRAVACFSVVSSRRQHRILHVISWQVNKQALAGWLCLC